MFSKVSTLSENDEVDEAEEIFDFQQLDNEINEMHKELNILQDRLHVTIANCPVEKSCENDVWVQLYGSQQPDIRNLQLQNRYLEMQMDGLKKCGQIAKLRIRGLQKRQFEQKTSLFELGGQYDWIHSKYMYMEHNHGKCLQRYRHNRTVYATWTEVHQSADELKMIYAKFLNQLQDRPTYCTRKKHILKELNMANSRCVGAIQVSLIRAKELGHHLDGFSTALRHFWHHQHHQQTLKDTNKRKHNSDEYYEDHIKTAHVTLNFESDDAFDWDLQSRKLRLKHGSVSEIEIVKPPALNWYGRMQKLMSINRKPSSFFLNRKN